MDPGEPIVLFRGLPEQLSFPPSEKRRLRNFARVLCERVAPGRAFTCLITTDRELRKLNRAFLGHDYATDVLSFPSHGDGFPGDLAISAQRAQAQARKLGHTCSDEIRVLMLHGLLHLAGMDHERDTGEMARAEQMWRGEFHLPSALIGRTARQRANR